MGALSPVGCQGVALSISAGIRPKDIILSINRTVMLYFYACCTLGMILNNYCSAIKHSFDHEGLQLVKWSNILHSHCAELCSTRIVLNDKVSNLQELVIILILLLLSAESWYHFNDSTVTETNSEWVSACKAYILFYVQRGTNSKYKNKH